MTTRDQQTPTCESSARTMAVRLKKSWEYPPAPTECHQCGRAHWRHGKCFGCWSDWARQVAERQIELDVWRQCEVDLDVVNPALTAAVEVLRRHVDAGHINALDLVNDLEELYLAAITTTHPTVVEHILKAA